MWRLLIVDDEPYIVDGLIELFHEMPELELELFKAYSAIEAMEWMNRTKIDIVLSDIRMPHTSGIELQQAVGKQWPYCKFIFLTGYDDFDYIQAALRSGSVDYVLKTEYDEAIVGAVEKAIEALKEDMRSHHFMKQARERLNMALSVLQKEYLLPHLEGDITAAQLKNSQMQELQIELDLGTSYYLVIGRVDHWEDKLSYADRTLLLFAIQNIAAEYFQGAASQVCQQLLIDSRNLLWYIRSERSGQFMLAILETIQNTCRELLALSVSFVVSSKPVEWEEMHLVYYRLRKLLGLGFGHHQEMLLTDDSSTLSSSELTDEEKESDVRRQLKKLALLADCLENGQQQQFNQVYSEMFALFSSNFSGKLEMYYTTCSLLLSYTNRWGLDINLDFALLHTREPELDAVMLELQQAANQLFEMKQTELAERTMGVVEKINQYIEQHLDGDLSLTQLAEIVHLNPSYLSRLYKISSGISLSEYINEVKLNKCRELLRQPYLKIHEVGSAVGFYSPPYFTRFIKKMVNMTPQEFRDSLK